MATFPSKFEAVRGKCLDAAWVASVATTLGIDPQARDSLQRRLYPWLNQALKHPRFKVSDKRQFLETAYQRSCFGSGEVLHGVGEQVHADGTQAVQGRFQGTFTLEWNGWPTHSLTSSVISILVQEVLGYDVTYFETGSGGPATQRMSEVRKGTCTPTHYNAEIWAASKMQVLSVYANESTAGGNGYVGQPGWFTLTTNLNEALKGPNADNSTAFQRPYSADFWHDFIRSDDLVNFYSIKKADMSLVASSAACPDGVMGCLNGCSKSYACTVAEQNGKECMVVAMMFSFFDPGFLQAAISNNNIPAYFCFSGYDGLETAVKDVMVKNGTITFYHCEPDLFHLQFEGKLQRIALPRTNPKVVATATGTFGETGYGGNTTNPVNVDFPEESLQKYFSNVLNQDAYLVDFLNKYQLTQVDINSLLKALVTIGTTSSNPPFTAACNWVKSNYQTWRTWLTPLPMCTLASHMQYTIAGCESNDTAFRNVSFAWTTPDPTDPQLPYVCDGGNTKLPQPLLTSRSCDWLANHVPVWSTWIQSKPLCDMSFYSYNIASCDADATRAVTFQWLLPVSATNRTYSSECAGGVPLPRDTTVQCDYVPTNSSAYSGMTAFSLLVMVILAGCMTMVALYRERPVIKRAQWPLLIVMICGGILLCVYVLLGAGAPSHALCASRPITLVLGYTLIFGSLLVKGLRVYWVFSNKAMKKVVVSLAKIVKILVVMLAVDVAILVAWMASDFPAPTTEIKKATEFIGVVDRVGCASSSFIFTALIIFWKAIITFGGMYVSFLIRHAGSDFQESVWIFASSSVVMLAALILLPLGYGADMAPAIQYTFQSIIILCGTLAVMGLMLGPKFYRLNASDKSVGGTQASKARSSNTNTAATGGRSTIHDSKVTLHKASETG